jgi:transcriptional regulator with XRE-family HTH domain
VIEEIRRRMKEQGLTQSELARRMGVSRARVWEILHGRRNLSAATIQRLANVLGDLVVRPEGE